MSFWQDASPAVKGAIVVGGILILYFVAAYFGGFFPWGSQVGDEIQQTRGIQPR
jgi:hypothetical protein